jgi:hypothetical protein
VDRRDTHGRGEDKDTHARDGDVYEADIDATFDAMLDDPDTPARGSVPDDAGFCG